MHCALTSLFRLDPAYSCLAKILQNMSNSNTCFFIITVWYSLSSPRLPKFQQSSNEIHPLTILSHPAFTFAGRDFGFVGIGLRAFSSHFAFSTVFLIWPNQLSCEACCRGQISADCSRITVMVFQSPAMDSILGAGQDHVHALSTF